MIDRKISVTKKQKNIFLFLSFILTLILFSAFGNFSSNVSADEKKSEKTIPKSMPLHHVSSKVCAECHEDIYDQWKGSMHAQSTALKDPIHGTFYKKVIGDPHKEGVLTKKGKYPVCLKCHVPNMAKDKKTKIDSKVAYEEGVNCVACHSLQSFKGTTNPQNGKMQLGIDAYNMANFLQGTNGPLSNFSGKEDDDNPHRNPFKPVSTDPKHFNLPMQGNAMMQTSAACMGCHDKRNNSHGVPLCATGDEIKHGNSQQSCQSCHMPAVNGVMDHAMGGGHSAQMLKRAVSITIEVTPNGPVLVTQVKISNMQPHNVPTGAPFRNARMKLTAFDKTGKILWSNYKTHPVKEDPQAYFDYKLLHNGKFAPPPKATAPGPDNRLKPFEDRLLTYQIPTSHVAIIRAEVFYNLLWPGLNKKFTNLPEKLRKSTRIAHKEFRL